MADMKSLFIGGARSGKSTLAARLAAERSREVCCIVTATETDAEMKQRIAAHRQARPAHWRVREAPVRMGAALSEEMASGRLVLIDCLTLWTANCLYPNPQAWARERKLFCEALARCKGEVILVTNEVGAGIVPQAASARVFRDEHGWLTQEVAALCDEVFMVVAGISLPLKSVSVRAPKPAASKRAVKVARSRTVPRRRRGNRR